MAKIKVDMETGWCKCGKCGHKLFKMNNTNPDSNLVFTAMNLMLSDIEIKCHSCKAINTAHDKCLEEIIKTIDI